MTVDVTNRAEFDEEDNEDTLRVAPTAAANQKI